jgi:hypothetical protein
VYYPPAIWYYLLFYIDIIVIVLWWYVLNMFLSIRRNTYIIFLHLTNSILLCCVVICCNLFCRLLISTYTLHVAIIPWFHLFSNAVLSWQLQHIKQNGFVLVILDSSFSNFLCTSSGSLSWILSCMICVVQIRNYARFYKYHQCDILLLWPFGSAI